MDTIEIEEFEKLQNKLRKTQKVVDTELNDILDYMNGLIENSDKYFALAKSISKQNKEEN